MHNMAAALEHTPGSGDLHHGIWVQGLHTCTIRPTLPTSDYRVKRSRVLLKRMPQQISKIPKTYTPEQEPWTPKTPETHSRPSHQSDGL